MVLAGNIRLSRQHHPRALRRGVLLPDRLDRARALLVRTAPTPHPHAAASQSVLLRHPADSRLCQWSVSPTVALSAAHWATPTYLPCNIARTGSGSGSSTVRRALPGRARLVARASSSSSSCTLNPKAAHARKRCWLLPAVAFLPHCPVHRPIVYSAGCAVHRSAVLHSGVGRPAARLRRLSTHSTL